MPEGDKDHGGVTMAVAVLPRRSHQRLDLMPSQIFARPQVAVLRPLRNDCSFFGGWGDQPERRICHGNSPVHRPHCSENAHFTNSRSRTDGTRIDTMQCFLLSIRMDDRSSIAVQLIAFAAFIAAMITLVLGSLTFVANQCAGGTPFLPAIFPCSNDGRP